jgi:Flp pilus assembly protein TadD
MCSDCHSTNVRKNYDAATRTYRTTWSEISVGCEACHGPGSIHLAWAEGPEARRGDDPRQGLVARLDDRRGAAWERDPETGRPRRTAPRTTEREIETCARCHSRRSQLTDEVTAGDSLHDGFRVSLLEPGLYHADGQMRDEVYTYGSFLESRMYAAGVTCSDCHDPHSGKAAPPGDALCAQCHVAARYESGSHHFHDPGSPGARCTACHMPTVTYMVVDPRHDHSFRVPRPDLAARIGTPSVCKDCHPDRSASWAAAAIARHHPDPWPAFQTFGEAFASLDRGAPGATRAVAAIAMDATQPAIIRASAWQRLGGRRGAFDVAQVTAAIRDASPLVRRAAAEALSSADPAARARLLAPLLSDPARSVRLEATSALTDAPPGSVPPEVMARAVAEFTQVMAYNADQPESLVTLSNLQARRGDVAGALASLTEARAIDPTWLPAYVNLADLHRLRGDEAQAEQVLRQALAIAGTSGAAHHALGLGLVRQGRGREALEYLAEAARREPSNTRFAFVHAVALHDAGQPERAVRELKRAQSLQPDDPEIAQALAAYEQGRPR